MILQAQIPYDLSQLKPLPGIAPLDPADWLQVDDAFAAQMEERARLLREVRETVLGIEPEAMPAAQELLEVVLAHLPEGYARDGEQVTRPDGVVVTLDRGDPMGTLGVLVQEDLCLLQKRGDEHVLTGAVLCFPAGWRLADKISRPLSIIHVPIPEYDENIGRRVQRLFDGVQPGRPLMRVNRLFHDDPLLHQPVPRRSNNDRASPKTAPYLRSERQCLLRLPETRAVVFSIHTYVVRRGPETL
ncbi:DUF3445 domain-containing protein [Salipiger sp. PrR002]|uniref:heme-dependent oxidative N-demethylase family protein n=1 Tax=Salipiger sp. PrR002 TaxID=2706489 RepID=UPI0013BD15A7|nr:DUF3445 domain-containing protein [Salipiger sp. PrR002]NDV99447.1 DUF3445 domain-containing protein [Salipiger sp. PrR002]NDW58677.1 DUF3445 domain-containing protein [Salipiger sp. PrR004]